MPYSQPRASRGAGWLLGSMKAAPAIRMIVASEVAAMILPTASMIFGCVRLAYSPQTAIRAMAGRPQEPQQGGAVVAQVVGRRGQCGQGRGDHEGDQISADAEVAPAGPFEKALGVEAGTHL